VDVADRELERMVECRSRNGESDPDEREELWQRSVSAYTARRNEENRLAWREYHQGQAECHRRTLKGLIAHHEARAERLCYQDRGEGIR
jgi:hypothetical protein